MSEAPFFVVGVARSGTTLLRWMLEQHPRLAIPPESWWVVELAGYDSRWSERRQRQVVAKILHHPKFDHWSLPEDVLRAAVRRRRPGSYAELVAAVFAAYAERRGKPRWGDKTPDYVHSIELLAGLFPDAVFLHIIRDGREVAASLIEQVWWDAPVVESAASWRRAVARARTVGDGLGPQRYCELRLEDLLTEPERTLRRVCAALREDYTPRMLEYPSRSFELSRWEAPDRWSHRHLAKPPTLGLRDWRRGLSASEMDAVDAICRPLLAQLGYEV